MVEQRSTWCLEKDSAGTHGRETGNTPGSPSLLRRDIRNRQRKMQGTLLDRSNEIAYTVVLAGNADRLRSVDRPFFLT